MQPSKRGSAITVLAVVALAACGSSGTTSAGTSPSADRGVKIAAVIKGLDNPFFQSMQQGIQGQAKTAGLDIPVEAAQSITDTAGQADKLTVLAKQDFSCFIVNPISGTNLLQGLAQLATNNKTIVNIDNPVDTAAAIALVAPDTYIGTDNVAAGAMAGKQMLALLPSGGTVATVSGIPGDITSNARVQGFSDATAGKLTIVEDLPASWDRQQALTQATTALVAHPDLAGFFVANDDMGLGVARAIADAGKTGQVKVISVDGIQDALDAVKAGEVDAVVAQYPYAIGSMAVEACQAAAAGKTLPADVKAPVQLVTKDNADQALAATPKPFQPYPDPFATLLK